MRVFNGLMVTVLMVFATQAQAQFEVKRVPCKDLIVGGLASGHGRAVFYNQTSATKELRVQIKRNGCRPASIAGFGFRLGYLPFNLVGGGYSTVRASGKHPMGQIYPVAARAYGTLTLDAPFDTNVRGTIDYLWSLD